MHYNTKINTLRGALNTHITIIKVARTHHQIFQKYYSGIPTSIPGQQIDSFKEHHFIDYWKEHLKEQHIGTRGYYSSLSTNNGELIGVSSTLPFDNDTIKLDKLYLKLEYRGEQLGKKLLLDLTIQALKDGYKKMIIETDPGAPRTNKFYQSLDGVENIGTKEREISEYTDNTTLTMQYYQIEDLKSVSLSLRERIRLQIAEPKNDNFATCCKN